MHKKKLLILSFLPFMIGCSSVSHLKTISDDDAIVKAALILKNQSDSSIFSLKNTYTIKSTQIDKENNYLETGSSTKKDTTTTTVQIDADDLKRKMSFKETTLTSGSSIEQYEYYDSTSQKIITLTNKNGKKTKLSSTLTYTTDTAQAYFKNFITLYKSLITGSSNLEKFSENVKKDQEDKEKYKDDQYFNYSYGSNDDHSLERQSELHANHDKPKEGFNATVTTKTDHIMQNDIVLLEYTESKIEGFKEGTSFSYQTFSSLKREINDTASITLPNPDEYSEQ